MHLIILFFFGTFSLLHNLYIFLDVFLRMLFRYLPVLSLKNIKKFTFLLTRTHAHIKNKILILIYLKMWEILTIHYLYTLIFLFAKFFHFVTLFLFSFLLHLTLTFYMEQNPFLTVVILLLVYFFTLTL